MTRERFRHRSARVCRFVALLCSILAIAGFTAAETQGKLNPDTTVVPSLLADTTAIASDKPFTVGIRLKLEKGWHIYWRFSGDSGLPPDVKWELPAGFIAGPIQWPIPSVLKEDPDLVGYVYYDEVMLLAQVTPPAALPNGEITLGAEVSWQVCNSETCAPPASGKVELTLPTGAQAPSANMDLFAAWRAKLPQGDAPFKTAWDRSKKDAFSLHLTGVQPAERLSFFPIPPTGAKPGHPKITGPDATGGATIEVPIENGGAPNLDWQGVIASGEGANQHGWLVSSAGAAQSTPQAATQAGSPVGNASSGPASPFTIPLPQADVQRSLGGVLLLAFLGGLILNIMPCVLPVISLKIFGFVQQAGESPGRVFRLGLSFVAGVFAFFLGVAIVVASLKAGGRDFNWSWQFQNAYVFAGMIALVFVFSLSLLGVFEVALSSAATTTLSTLSSKEGYAGAFLHGLFTTLLGTSCTAPFLSASLGYATTQPPSGILAIFMAIAAGMSLPYFLLTAHPAWMRYLPKPGLWMERAKQIMGFAILAVAVWLLGIFAQSRPESSAGLLHFLLALAFACWLFGVIRNRWAGLALAVLVAGGAYLLLLKDALAAAETSPQVAGSVEDNGVVWQPFSADRLESSVKKGQPVFIDFTAEWCINCKHYEGTVLKTDAVREAMRKKNVLALRADWTRQSPELTEWIHRFGRKGVPVYVLYRPGDAHPIVFDSLDKQDLLDQLAKIKS